MDRGGCIATQNTERGRNGQITLRRYSGWVKHSPRFPNMLRAKSHLFSFGKDPSTLDAIVGLALHCQNRTAGRCRKRSDERISAKE